MNSWLTVWHTGSLLLLALLFLFAIAWKQVRGGEAEVRSGQIEMSAEMQSTVEFWNYYQKATTLRVERAYEEAAAAYEQALERNEEHRDALYYSGHMALMLRQFGRAETYWQRLSGVDPDSPRGPRQLGTLYFCLERGNETFDPKRAAIMYEKAWSMNREETGPPMALARLALHAGELERARELVDIVRLSNRMSYQALFLTGYLEWKRGEESSAGQWLERASGLYRNLTRLEIHGEGATERGAQAMLSEDLFCDVIGLRIGELIGSEPAGSRKSLFELFDRDLESWRQEL